MRHRAVRRTADLANPERLAGDAWCQTLITRVADNPLQTSLARHGERHALSTVASATLRIIESSTFP